MKFSQWFNRPWLILLAVFLAQWLMLFSIKQPTWDAVSYYIYARSAVFDQDLDFENDYQLSYPTAGEHFASKRLDQITTETGKVENLFAVGASLLWLPWLAVLRLMGTFFSPGQVITGYENYYVTTIATLSALWGLLAFWIAFRLAQGIVSKQLALIATITFLFASPLLYYQFREPMYAHAASAMTVALCVYAWWKQHDQIGSTYQALGLGALIGLAALVRWQNLSYMLLPLVSTTLVMWKLPGVTRRQTVAPAVIYLLTIVVSASAVFLLQMTMWKVLYGHFITIPQGGGFFDLRAPFLDSLLLSSFRGVLAWMPVFFFAFAGLVMLSLKKPQLGVPMLLMLLFALYINGSTRDWFAGGGYGPRRLSGTLVLLVTGYAVLLQWLPSRIRVGSAVVLGAALALHQWILLRFGIPERLGGRVVSMEPTYLWEEESLPTFFGRLLGKVPQAWARSFDFFVLPDSPLYLLVKERIWPAQHLMSLVMAAIILLLIIAAGFYLGKRRGVQGYMVLLAVMVLGFLELWILIWSE